MLNDGSHSYTYDAENKISKVDSVNAYVYDGEGQRVRKLVGENLRFVYGIGGELIMEFSGSSGVLMKEYVYGANGLLATIEPSAINSNGTRYATADNLGSPRVVTNSGAAVVSRHDYKPFGEEISSGTGPRTTAMGFPGASDGLRQKFTGYERDAETMLDFAQARYFKSTYGRFTGADPFMGSGKTTNSQTWNRYAYSLNNPLRYIDPSGAVTVGVTTEEEQKQDEQSQPQKQQTPQQPTQSAANTTSQVPTDVKINAPQPNTMLNIPFAGRLFTGVGSILELTVTDQNGDAIPNATVMESVTPSTTTQSADPITFPTGTVTDLVGRGVNRSDPVSVDEGISILKTVLQTPTTITQDHRLTIMSPTNPGVTAIATHRRTLSNVDSQGNLRPFVNPATGKSMNNFSLSVSPVSVTRVPTVMCPRAF